MSEIASTAGPERCTKCPLGTGSKTNCLRSRFDTSGTTGASKITFVYENPSREDDSVGVAMTERGLSPVLTAGQAVWEVLQQHSIDPNEVNFVPLVRCRNSAKDAKLTDDVVKACLPYLWDELRMHPPKLVVAMGATVAKYLTGNGKLGLARGNFAPMRLHKKLGAVPEDLVTLPITATAAPGAVYYQKANGVGTGRNDFVSDLGQMLLFIGGQSRDARADYKWMDTIDEIDRYLTHVEVLYANGEIPGCIVDVETNQHLNPHKGTAQLVAIGFSHKAWFGRAVKINHKDATLWDETPGAWQWFIDRLNRFFSLVPTGGWNYKFDIKWIRKHLGVRFFLRPFFDGHLLHNALFSELAPHDLKNVSIQLTGNAIAEGPLHAAMQKLRHIYPQNPERWHMGWVDAEILLNYLCGDVDKSFQNYTILDPMSYDDTMYMPEEYRKKYPGMNHRKAYERLMLDAILPFSKIEDNGLKVNRSMLSWMEREYPKRLESNIQPLMEHRWTQAVVADMRAEVERNAVEKERLRVANRNQKEVLKAQEKPGYVPKVFVERPLSELKLKYKPERQAISYFMNLSQVIYDKAQVPASELGIETKTKVHKNGRVTIYASTRAAVLTKVREWAIINGHKEIAEFVGRVEAVKKDEKLYSAYVKGMPELIDPDGLLRTTYNLTGARTGRCSTTDPNLHAMPTRNADDPLAIIKLFESRWVKQGGLILALDYSAMELRIVAAIADEPALIKVFLEGGDPHRATAAAVFKKDPKDVTSDERKAGKTLNFGILYGMSSAGLAARLGTSVEEAEKMIEGFFEGLPKIAAWIEKQKKDMLKRAVIAPNTGREITNPRFNPNKPKTRNNTPKKVVEYQMEQYGYIVTPFDRKRILKNARHWEFGLASKAERQAVNTPIQSIASDIALEATIRIQNRFEQEGLKSLVFGFIHDSIKSDVAPRELFPAFHIMKEEMEETPKRLYPWLGLPIETSAEVGTGWGYHAEIKKADFVNNTIELHGDETNLGLIERALRCEHDVQITGNEPIIDKGKQIGFQRTLQAHLAARSIAA